ncbi:MAG: hypothetical protein FWD48_06260 [Oscillospiraceae bacterium]|nr:hypothetical protein [Oscillospiraceae bacterium]
MVKDNLDDLIEKYKVQPIGHGYIDCIISLDNVFNFINDLSKMKFNVYGLTWWCHCKDENSDCPHGMGGSKSKFYQGWFSEMQLPLIKFEDNEQVKTYIKTPNDDRILKCFVPALWIDVPDYWRNNL